MILTEALKVIDKSTRIKLYVGYELEYVGFAGCLEYRNVNTDALNVFRIENDPEIRHKDYNEKGYTAPIEPDQAREYYFADLTLLSYLAIYTAPIG
jgi:hypothetical protein